MMRNETEGSLAVGGVNLPGGKIVISGIYAVTDFALRFYTVNLDSGAMDELNTWITDYLVHKALIVDDQMYMVEGATLPGFRVNAPGEEVVNIGVGNLQSRTRRFIASQGEPNLESGTPGDVYVSTRGGHFHLRDCKATYTEFHNQALFVATGLVFRNNLLVGLWKDRVRGSDLDQESEYGLVASGSDFVMLTNSHMSPDPDNPWTTIVSMSNWLDSTIYVFHLEYAGFDNDEPSI